MFRCIGGNGEGGGEVREVKDGFGEEEAFEGVERRLTGGGPVPREVLFSEVEERASNVGIVRDESSIEVGETKERANVFHLSWCRPIRDAVEFDRIHGQLAGFHDHAEVFYLVSGEFAFLEFQMKVQFSHVLQDALRAFLMEGGVGGVDEEIIHVDNEPSFGNHIPEGVVHETLERGRGVGESKEHHRGFEEPSVGDEGGLPLVSVLDPYVIVPPSDVELGKDLSISQFVYEVGDERKGIGVANGVFVDVAIVLTRAESSVFLFDEEEG